MKSKNKEPTMLQKLLAFVVIKLQDWWLTRSQQMKEPDYKKAFNTASPGIFLAKLIKTSQDI